MLRLPLHGAPSPSLPLPLTPPPAGSIGKHGEYWVSLQLALPASVGGEGYKVRLQVDTGSAGLVLLRHNASLDAAPSLPCKDCDACDKRGFCPFSIEYGDGSSEYALHVLGRIAMLRLVVDSSHSFSSVPVHLAYNVTGHLPTRVDGILGLAFGALDCNPTCVKPAWNVLGKTFEIQLGDVGGHFAVHSSGRLPGPPHQVPVLDAPVLGNPKSYYTVAFPGIAVNDALIYGHASTMAVVDSGTTLMILTPTQYDGIKAEMQRNYCHLPGVCGLENIFQPGRCLVRYHAQYPSLYFFIAGGALKVPPALYFFEVQGVYCLAMQRGPPGLHGAILGDALLRGFTTSFSPHRVQFSPRNASLPVANLLSHDQLVIPSVKNGLALPRRPSNFNSDMLTVLLSFVLLYWLVLRCCCRPPSRVLLAQRQEEVYEEI